MSTLLLAEETLDPLVSDRDAKTAIVQAVAEQFHCDFLIEIEPDMLDGELVSDLPVEYARQRAVLPIRYKDRLAVVTCDPAHVIGHDDMTLLLGEEPILVVAPRADVLAGIETCYFQQRDNASATIEGMETSIEDSSGTSASDLLRTSDQAPVTRWVNSILLEALQEGASDIHIEPFDRRVQVRYRVDGVLVSHGEAPKSMEANIASRLKIMGGLDIAEKRLPQDGMARVAIGEREVDIRISTVPVAEGERIVLRLLRHDTAMLSLQQLGMRRSTLETFQSLLDEPHGVLWVTGPTGSGKTTTLYSALGQVDTQRKNVMTIEDPIEYQVQNIGQIAVKPKIGLTFASGLRHILRQDPDIILVGETRDTETAEIVVQASLTGHLVFSTLHTNHALGAVTRLSDMGVEPFLVAESSQAAMAQRLVRKLCTSCRRETTVSDGDVRALGEWAKELQGKTTYEAVGCDACREGYAGRIGIFELVVFDGEIREAIRSGVSMHRLQEIAAASDSLTLREDAVAKILSGDTDPHEVRTVLGALDAV